LGYYCVNMRIKSLFMAFQCYFSALVRLIYVI